MFFFFFSSRRRHTRLQGDWSSDVCSSDLIVTGTADWWWVIPPGFAIAIVSLSFVLDRKSTRLNSSHLVISYAVFCLKKKTISSHPPYRLYKLFTLSPAWSLVRVPVLSPTT